MDEDSGYLPSNSVFYDVKNRKEVKSDMVIHCFCYELILIMYLIF
jgi:hypothetical protein